MVLYSRAETKTPKLTDTSAILFGSGSVGGEQ
jgi:hypothetical protein